uniref:SpaW n=1 Tax=Spirochaeta aurantia TaxID=147 RepID=Q0PHX6_SPIAU|nr:SpaW [Spirochaeta aurantia]
MDFTPSQPRFRSSNANCSPCELSPGNAISGSWRTLDMMNAIVEQDLDMIVSDRALFEAFRGKVVLITGAAGFLPAYMVEALLLLNRLEPGFGVKVIGVVRRLPRARERFAELLGDPALELIEGDVATWIPTMPVDYVIHAASQASPKYYGADPVGTILPNVLGTHRLLEHCAHNPVSGFLFFSSGEVYGQVDDARMPMDETCYGFLDPMAVRSCYGESKRLGETLCVSYWHQYGVAAKVVRPFHTYGPGMDLADGRSFADFVAAIVRRKNIELKSDGTAQRPFCYLADAIRGFFLVLVRGESGKAYNVGNPHAEISIGQLAELMVGLYPELGLRVDRIGDRQPTGYLKSPIARNCPDIRRIEALGWHPQIGLEEGFRRTVESFLVG